MLFENELALNRYQADLAFMSCRSFQIPGGSFEHSQALTSTKRALASIASRKILLLDYSKWNVSSICNSIPLKNIDVIITDTKAPQANIDEVIRLGIELVIVDPLNPQSVQHYNTR